MIRWLNSSPSRVRATDQTLGSACLPTFFEVIEAESSPLLVLFQKGESCHHLDEGLDRFKFGGVFGRRRKVLINGAVLDTVEDLKHVMLGSHHERWDPIVKDTKVRGLVAGMKGARVGREHTGARSKGVRGIHRCSLHGGGYVGRSVRLIGLWDSCARSFGRRIRFCERNVSSSVNTKKEFCSVMMFSCEEDGKNVVPPRAARREDEMV